MTTEIYIKISADLAEAVAVLFCFMLEIYKCRIQWIWFIALYVVPIITFNLKGLRLYKYFKNKMYAD